MLFYIIFILRDSATGRIAVYYGCADTVTGLAFTTIDKLSLFDKYPDFWNCNPAYYPFTHLHENRSRPLSHWDGWRLASDLSWRTQDMQRLCIPDGMRIAGSHPRWIRQKYPYSLTGCHNEKRRHNHPRKVLQRCWKYCLRWPEAHGRNRYAVICTHAVKPLFF
mgnify:CR=1 FL=1